MTSHAVEIKTKLPTSSRVLSRSGLGMLVSANSPPRRCKFPPSFLKFSDNTMASHHLSRG